MVLSRSPVCFYSSKRAIQTVLRLQSFESGSMPHLGLHMTAFIAAFIRAIDGGSRTPPHHGIVFAIRHTKPCRTGLIAERGFGRRLGAAN